MLTDQQVAEICHEANRVLAAKLGEESPPWDELDEHTRESCLDGVRNALRGATPEESHENWMQFKEAEGWRWGPEKDLEAKTHPCLVPYSQLPPEQRLKDHLFVAIVRTLGGLNER